MARITFPSHFDSVAQIKETFGLVLPKPHDWRLLNPSLVGEINALPGSRGVAIATNGVYVIVLQNDKIFTGHMDWFVVDEEETMKRAPSLPAAKVHNSKKQPKVDISEFV